MLFCVRADPNCIPGIVILDKIETSVIVTFCSHLPSENTSHNESKQLVNGLPEDLKPELAMPKNGESHREELHSDATVS